MKDLKITKGECKTEYPIIDNFIIHSDGLIIAKVLLNDGDLFEQESNALLITDTFNTAQKCNLLPSELLEQRDDLLGLLEKMTNYLNGMDSNNNIVLRIPLELSEKIGETIQSIKKAQQ